MLSLRERAFCVAAERALGKRADARCTRLGPDAGRFLEALRADRSLGAIETLDAPEVPSADVHPTWYETPPPSGRPHVERYLQRMFYGQLLPVAAPRSPSSAERAERPPLDAFGAEKLARLLTDLGRRRLAIAFCAAGPTELGQLCARLREPFASELIAEVRSLASVTVDEVRAAQRGLLRLPKERMRSGEELLLEAGCSWLGPALHARGNDELQRLALRLPRGLGRRLLDAAFSGSTTVAEQQAALRMLTALGVGV